MFVYFDSYKYCKSSYAASNNWNVIDSRNSQKVLEILTEF